MAENRQYDHEYKVQAVKLAKEIGQAKAAKERLIHTDPAVGVITIIFLKDFHHGVCQGLILPWAVFICKVLVESLPADMKGSTVKEDIPF